MNLWQGTYTRVLMECSNLKHSSELKFDDHISFVNKTSIYNADLQPKSSWYTKSA